MNKNKSAFLAFLLALGLFTLVGCGKDEKKKDEPKKEEKVKEVVSEKFDATKYTKAVEKYTLTATNKKASIDLAYAKDSGYTADTSKATYRLILENAKDTSKTEVQFFNTKLESSKAVAKKEEKDFDSSKIKNYSKLTYDDKEGWEVYRTTSDGNIISYEAQLFLGEADKDGMTSAAKITVTVNSTTDEGKKFDFEKYVKSDDFQYLLYSISLKK